MYMQYKKNIRLRIYVLSLYIVLLPIDATLGNIIGSTSIVNYIIIMYILLRLFTLLMDGKINVINLRKCNIISLYFIYFLVSITWSITDDISSWYVLSLVGSFSMFFLATVDIYSIAEINFFKKSVIFSAVLVIISVFLNYDSFSGGRLILSIGRYMDPNFFATGLILITAVLMDNILKKEYEKLNMIILILIVVIIIMTGSRGGLLANVAVILTAFLLNKKNSFRKISIILSAIIVSSLIVYFTLDYIPSVVLDRFMMNELINGGGTGRYENWKLNIEYYFKSPILLRLIFGNGFSTYPNISLKTLGIPQVAHNIYAQSLIEGGIIGFSLIMGIIIKSIKSAFSKNVFVVTLIVGAAIGGMSVDIHICRFFWNILFFSIIMNYEQNDFGGNIE